MKYWTKHGMMGMIGKNGKLSDSSVYFYKNSKNIITFDVAYTCNHCKVSYSYITAQSPVPASLYFI